MFITLLKFKFKMICLILRHRFLRRFSSEFELEFQKLFCQLFVEKKNEITLFFLEFLLLLLCKFIQEKIFEKFHLATIPHHHHCHNMKWKIFVMSQKLKNFADIYLFIHHSFPQLYCLSRMNEANDNFSIDLHNQHR